jgi:uncharacterized protein (DUF169 family)
VTEIQLLEAITGEPWTALRFEEAATLPPGGFVRLCTAVGRSFREELVLDCAELTCVGAPRNLGRDGDDDALVARMAEHAGVPRDRAARIVAETPCFRRPLRFIRIGRLDDADVLLAYLTPAAAMKLLRRWQLAYGRTLQTSLSSFMSVCSCVAAAGSAGVPAFSFGCGDAREHGGLGADRLIVALPADLVRQMQRLGPPFPPPQQPQPTLDHSDPSGRPEDRSGGGSDGESSRDPGGGER